MKLLSLEVGIIRSAFRGWEGVADIAPGGLEIDDWSIGAREFNYRFGESPCRH